MAIESTQTQPSRHRLTAAQKELELHIEGDHFHPLEAIALFRRWPRSFVRNIIYTFIFNACFAVGFLILGLMFARVDSLAQLADAFGRNLVISNIVGFAFWGVFELLGPLIRIVNRQSFAMIVFLYAAIGTVIVSYRAVFLRSPLFPVTKTSGNGYSRRNN